ncbi:MAG: hypothetical protein IPN34_19745 [Planctomycetes bacterium]|nr:hypothetical protein [Planctomycetota bacterium]
MSAPSGFTRVHVPARLADLAFSYLRPDDWVEAELPVEEHDFEKPTTCAPLTLCHPGFALIVFTVGARPAFADGTVAQWLEYLLREQGYDPSPPEEELLDAHRAAACWLTTVENGTAIRQRVMALEDGGRLLLLGALAPRELWDGAEEKLATMLRSFTLERPQGPTFELAPADRPLEKSSFFAMQKVETKGREEAPPAPPEPVPVDDALDPEHPTNARLRDNGVGLVPRILARDEASGFSTLGVGSLVMLVKVPPGWHAIDDGRRLLVFDGPGGTQINVRRYRREGSTDEEILQLRLDAAHQEWPGVEHLRLELESLPCLGLRNFEIEGEKLEQVYLLRSIGDDEVLEARVTSTPEKIGAALDVAHPLLVTAEVPVGV